MLTFASSYLRIHDTSSGSQSLVAQKCPLRDGVLDFKTGHVGAVLLRELDADDRFEPRDRAADGALSDTELPGRFEKLLCSATATKVAMRW